MLPLWTAGIDPDVIVAHVAPITSADNLLPFDLRAVRSRVVRGPTAQHIAILSGSGFTRVDLLDGTIDDDPVALRFDLPFDTHLVRRLAAVRRCAGLMPVAAPDRRAVRGLTAIQAAIERRNGAGLREIAAALLGPGAWPGDGDHRKSRVRRLVADGDRLLAAGHRTLLAG